MAEKEKEMTPFEKRMSFEEGPIAPLDGKYTMTREEALRQLGFEEDANKEKIGNIINKVKNAK